jgi:hypothetical protein
VFRTTMARRANGKQIIAVCLHQQLMISSHRLRAFAVNKALQL